MKRYLVDAEHMRLDGPDQPQRSPSGAAKVRVYIAPPVDARIAELEQALGRAIELFQDECDIVAEPDSYEWLQTSKSLMGT